MKNLIVLLGLMFLVTLSYGQNSAKQDELNRIREFKASLNSRNVNPVDKIALSDYQQRDLETTLEYGEPPDWNWVDHFGGSGQDITWDITHDSEGNILICGSFSGTMSIEDSSFTSQGDRDAFVAKFQADGTLMWIKHFPTSSGFSIEANGLYVDNSGIIYFTGYYSGESQIGEFSLNDNDSYDIFFGWMNPDGNVLMAKNAPEAGAEASGIKIQKDNEGKIYVLGINSSKVMVFNKNTFILKYDANGNYINVYSPGQNIYDIKIADNHIYYSGTILNSGYIGNFYFELHNIYNAFAAKSDLDFNFGWAIMAEQTSSGSGYSYCQGMYLTPRNEIVLGAYYRKNTILGGFQVGGNETFVAKCDSNGMVNWMSNLGSDDDNNSINTICGNDNYFYVAYNNGALFTSSSNSPYRISQVNTYTGSMISNQKTDYKTLCMEPDPSGNKIDLSTDMDQLIGISQMNPSLTTIWTKKFDGNSAYADVIGMVSDHLGDLYIYGYASNKMDYLGQDINRGLFLAKQNSAGNLIWIREFPDGFNKSGVGNYIIADTINYNIFITGNFYEPLSISGATTLIPGNNGSTFIIKYDLQGTFIWAEQIDFPADNLCLANDKQGNIIINGNYLGQILIGNTYLNDNGNGEIFIAKYDKDGNSLWAIQAGGEGDDDADWAGLTSADASGNIYFTAEIDGSNVLVNDYPLSLQEGDGNTVIAKISPAGQVLWAKVKAGSTIEYGDYRSWPTGIQASDDGYCYIKGWYGDSTYFDEQLLISPYNYFSYYIAKLDASGDIIWINPIIETQYGFDYNQFSIDQTGNVYLGAQVHQTVYFGSDFTYNCSGYSDLFLAKYTNTGLLDWVKTMEGTTTSLNYKFVSVAVFNETCLYAAGTFNNYLKMSGGTTLTSTNQHGFVAQIGQASWINTYSKDRVYDLFDLYPNPSSGKFKIELKENPALPVDVTITDIEGKAVYSCSMMIMEKSRLIELEDVSPGIYLVKCCIGEKFEAQKLLIK